jgi:hypothetical protein
VILLARWLSFLAAVTFTGVFLVTAPANAAMNRFEQSSVTLKPFAETASYGFDLKALGADGPQVSWKPNTTGTSGIEIFLNGLIGFGIAGRGVMSNEDRVNKGDTSYEDWRFTLTYPSLLISLDYERFQGFYVDNTGEIDATMASGPKIQAANMALQNYDLGFLWIFRPESFSLEAAVDQTVRQEESGGSWLAGASFYETDVSNDTSIVPAQVRSRYGADQNVSSARFHSALIRGGYGYTLVLSKKWFATAEATLGLGPQWSDYSDNTQTKHFGQGMSMENVLLALGYNGDSYFSTAKVSVNSSTYRTESIGVSSNLYSFKLALGARF